MLLADSAQVADGKLYILGGGWSVTGPDPTPSAVAMKVGVDWHEFNTEHHWELFLEDADGQPGWAISYGYYYETYERRKGRWVFTTRRWQRYIGVGSNGVHFPSGPIKGAEAFSTFKP